MKPFEITKQHAEYLLENYKSKIPLTKLTYKYGGIISVSSLPSYKMNFDNYKGLMAWYGLNNKNQLILLFEDNVWYDPENPPCSINNPDCLPENEELIESKRILKNKNFGKKKNERLKGFNLDGIGNEKDEFPSKEEGVKDAIEKFKKSFHRDSQNEKFVKYPYAFFMKDDEGDVYKFLQQDGLVNIAYFFGFDDSDNAHKMTNRIRVVLIGLDGNGKFLKKKEGKEELLSEDGMILQNSWPPNP